MEKTLKKGAEPSKKSNVDSMTADLVEELMNASTSFHKLHLQVEGIGSFAAHKALNEIYDALPGLADSIAEGYQGAAEKLLVYNDQGPVILKSVKDAISYLRDITSMVDELQKVMPYSEIVNTLDTVKDAVNSAKYKLIFLK